MSYPTQILPVPEKSWQWSINNILEAESTGQLQAAQFFITMKNALKAFLLSSFTVTGSSDSVTAGMDAVDRLSDKTKIVASAGNHSWIVLRQPATGAEHCYDFNVANQYNVSRAFSPAAGFTGGTIAARPTAADETAVASESWLIDNTADRMRLHVFNSTDGLQTAIVGMYQGVVCHLQFMGQAADAVTGWTNPNYWSLDRTAGSPTSTALQQANRYMTDNGSSNRFKARGPLGNMTLTMSIEGSNGGGSNACLADIMAYAPNKTASPSDFWPVQPIAFASFTASMQGRHGRMVDLWRTATGIPSGMLLRDSAGTVLAVFGGWVFPWSSDLPGPLPV